MRRKTLLLAFVFAVVGGGATFLAVTRATGPAQARPTEAVLVAARAVAIGAALRAGDVVVERMALGQAPADAAREPAEVEGRFAEVPLMKGEIVRRSRLADAPPGSRLAAVIPEGRVAVTVAVSDVISTGGFLAPGDHVDVLGVVSKEATGIASVVLTDVVVIAVSSTLVGSGQPEPPAPARGGAVQANPKGLDSTVTLAVTIQEAQRLVQVDEVGKLRLALRRRAEGTAALSR